jgi:nucleotide-binding universal stress UspA family protein
MIMVRGIKNLKRNPKIMTNKPGEYSSAIEDFHRARRRSALERILARLTGRSVDLLSYEEVRKKLKIGGRKRPDLREIPIDAIVGSVDRYTDFTRSFLPKESTRADRWAGVKVAVTDLQGLPPISVYKIGEAYFVEDGNHRVSVARDLGQSHIQAYVTELETKVPVSPQDNIDDLILKAEYVDFLEHTHLDRTRMESDLRLTVPGGYQTLEEHIAVHRHFMGIERQREIPFEEAAAHWYDEVYFPVVHTIREQGILRDFPGRTEADLYLWISEHRAALKEMLQMEIDTSQAASDLAAQQSPRPERVVARLSDKILDALIPDELETGISQGVVLRARAGDRETLFEDILVPISGNEASFNALEQAILVAQREGARVYGLHILPEEDETESQAVQSLKSKFDSRCAEAGVPGYLVLSTGKVARTICERARWTDLVTLNVSFPPPPQALGRLSSGLSSVIRRCSRPILTVPGKTTSLNRALLAYDGGRKSQEALYVASYLANRWKVQLTVISVDEHGFTAQDMLDGAQKYLDEHRVQAQMILRHGPIAEAILEAAGEVESDVLVLGGYGRQVLPEIVLGSVVDEVLRKAGLPVFICS